jgi:protein-tyrosine-phosphatase
MAEGMLRSRLSALGARGIEVRSMGTAGLFDEPASERAQLVCRERGVDISSHRSSGLLPAILDRAELVLTMELVHIELVLECCPAVAGRVFLLGAWPRAAARIEDTVPDPMGRLLKCYQDVAAAIETHVERVARALIQSDTCRPPST